MTTERERERAGERPLLLWLVVYSHEHAAWYWDVGKSFGKWRRLRSTGYGTSAGARRAARRWLSVYCPTCKLRYKGTFGPKANPR